MKVIRLGDSSFSFIKVNPGEIDYVINWSDKPHRNVFRNRGRSIIKLTIKDELWIGETLVTQELWDHIMNINPSYFKNENYPVDSVSYENCQVFIDKLSEYCNVKFRLLTEKEYIYACLLNYPESIMLEKKKYIWHEANSRQSTQHVKEKFPGVIGAYDLLGNLHHLLNPDITELRQGECVYRGASWATPDLWVDKDYAFKMNVKDSKNTVGIRLAMV
jgi:formylglycine-generating enzyme required for sulfatase activity